MRPFSISVTPFIAVILLCTCSRSDKDHSGDQYKLGEIRFDVQSTPEAAAQFQKGMLLLHSFEYQDAASAFREARSLDPDLALAYWGEAMTYNHPLWNAQFYDDARSVMEELGSSPAERKSKGRNPVEQALLESLDILYGKGEKFDRDKAYAAYMGELFTEYPDNQEIAAFYALSLLGEAGESRDSLLFERSAVISQQILEENPNHPGALHYLIHAYDDPAHAVNALSAAHSYAEVAPDASHALHMPSHIFVALGMWDEVVKSNIASFGASVSRMERLDLDGDARSYHALHWLQYGYLQQGNAEMGKELLNDMRDYTAQLPSANARAHLTMMRATYVVDAGDCADSVASLQIDDGDLNEVFQALNVFVPAYCAYKNGDPNTLETSIDSIAAIRTAAEHEVLKRGVTMCSGVGWAVQLPSPLDIGHMTVLETQLRALHADLKGDSKLAEQLLREAAEHEHALTYSYGPPIVAKPSYELLADWLQTSGREEEADAAYRKVLRRAPKRLHASREIASL